MMASIMRKAASSSKPSFKKTAASWFLRLNWAQHCCSKASIQTANVKPLRSMICMQWSANLSSRENLPRMSIPKSTSVPSVVCKFLHAHLNLSGQATCPVRIQLLACALLKHVALAEGLHDDRTRLCLATAKPSWDLVENWLRSFGSPRRGCGISKPSKTRTAYVERTLLKAVLPFLRPRPWHICIDLLINLSNSGHADRRYGKLMSRLFISSTKNKRTNKMWFCWIEAPWQAGGVATSSSKEEVDVTRSSWGHMRWRYFNGIPPWPPRTNSRLAQITRHLTTSSKRILTDWVDPSGANNMESLPSLAAAAPPPLFPKLSLHSLWASIANCQASCASATPRVPSTGPKIRWINNSETLIETYVKLIMRGWKCSSTFMYCITNSASIEIQYKSWPLLQMVGSAPGHFSLDFQSSLGCRSFLNPQPQSGRTKCKNHWSEAGNLH